MKPKLLQIVMSIMTLVFCQNLLAQVGISSISTGNSNLATADTLFNRKGGGVKSSITGLADRWDSVGTNFKLVFNAGAADSVFVNAVTITGVGTGIRLPFNAIAKVRRVANADVNNTSDHFSYWTAVNGAPAATDNTGTFLVSAPEIRSLENALVANNINTGVDNIFQNQSENVHYANIERIDYIIPNGILPADAAEITKLGFTIYGRGTGKSFKIAGIKKIDDNGDPSVFVTPLLAVEGSDFGSNLLATNMDYVVFQKDPNFSYCESRPSIKMSENIKGVFVSFESLGFMPSQKIYGFSIFASDVPTGSSSAYLQDYTGFPTNTNGTDMLDLVNSFAVVSFNQSVLASASVLKATLQNTKVLLQWNTESSIQIEKLVLQKASNNSLYEDVVILNLNQTSYVDETQNGDVAYYRLKTVLKDGNIKYSNIQFISFKTKITKVFPTITNAVLNISSNALQINKPAAIKIYSFEGKLIYSTIEKASSFMHVDVASLQKGMYLIVVSQNDEKICSQQFIKN